MSVLKSFVIAFSMYSKIPMPQFAWKEKDMRYVMIFFPWVGIVLGACVFFWGMLCERAGFGALLATAFGTALPLLVTGGIHVDGFMDTMDALHSYQEREKKLEILKDAHIGAFSVICLVVYYLLYFGFYSEIHGEKAFFVLAAGFYLSRILSAIGVVSFRAAKSEGLLYLFSDTAQKKTVCFWLYLQFAVCTGLLFYTNGISGGITVLISLGWLFLYRGKCEKEFGGTTGDTAGFFLSISELLTVMAAGIFGIIGG